MADTYAPFEVIYKAAKIGEVQVPPVWVVPFDKVPREVSVPNAPPATVPAYASIGWYVTRHPFVFCPSYYVVEKISLRIKRTPEELEAWQTRTKDTITVTDRIAGVSYSLHSATSDFEAVVSWYAREFEIENSILCFDRADNEWYIEAPRNELTVALDTDGREVPPDEPHVQAHYNITAHPNAVMRKGE